MQQAGAFYQQQQKQFKQWQEDWMYPIDGQRPQLAPAQVNIPTGWDTRSADIRESVPGIWQEVQQESMWKILQEVF
jgi:hypothetical protein